MATKRQILEAQLTSSCLYFTRYFFKKRFKKKFIVADHHKKICDALDLVLRGKVTRLIINVAPRLGKTEIAVKNFVALGFAINPQSKFLHLTYSNSLALDNSEEVRDTFVLNPEYSSIFPYVKLDKSSKAKNKWDTTVGGGMYAAAAGGSVTGFGAGEVEEINEEQSKEIEDNLEKINNKEENEINAFLNSFDGTDGFAGAIIIDDPIKPDNALSQVERDKVNRRWTNTIKSRANSIRTPIIIIGQRLHPDDFCGNILEREGEEWHVLTLPSLQEDENGNEISIWEGKLPKKELIKMKEDDPYTFQSQYQQNPQPIEGLLFPKQTTRFCSQLPPREEWEYIFQQIDPKDEGKDYFASGIYVLCKGNVYVADYIFTQDNTDLTPARVIEQILEFKPSRSNIESNAGWSLYKKSIRDKLIEIKNSCEVYGLHSAKNKEMRIFNEAPTVRKKFIYLDSEHQSEEYKKAMKFRDSYLKMVENQVDDNVDIDAAASVYLKKMNAID